MTTPLASVSGALLPEAELSRLAPLRAHEAVRAAKVGERVLVSFAAGDARAIACAAPAPGAVLLERRDEAWFRLGTRLPLELPAPDELSDLSLLVAPAPLVPERARPHAGPAAELRLEPCQSHHDTSGVLTTATALERFAGEATTASLERLRAARAGAHVLVLGAPPPALGGTRLWGRRVLQPLGLALSPRLGDEGLARVLDLAPAELAVVLAAEVLVVPGKALAPLSRAQARLAAREARAGGPA